MSNKLRLFFIFFAIQSTNVWCFHGASSFSQSAYETASQTLIDKISILNQKQKTPTDLQKLSKGLHQVILNGFNLSELAKLCKAHGYAANTNCVNKNVANKALYSLNISALHLAVLLRDRDAVRFLIEKGASFTSKAKKNWTPAHLTALHGDKDILNLLVQLGDELQSKEIYGATALELWELAHLRDPSEQIIHVWNDETGEVEDIDGYEFQRLTNSYFVETVKISPEVLADEWTRTGPARSTDNGVRPLLKVIASFQKKSTVYDNLYLKRIHVEDADGQKLSLGFGLFAKKDFVAGEVVSDYQGEWLGEKTASGAEYATQNIDAKELRGYLAFSSDGAPNGGLIPVPKTMGLELTEALVALSPIRSHDQILWNYGSHDIKWDMYKELDLESPRQFLKTHPFKNLRSDYSKLREDTIEFYYYVSMFGYITGTLPVILRLYGEGFIDLKDLNTLEFSTLSGNFETYGVHFINFVKAMERSSNKQLVLDFFIKKVREGNVQILTNFIYQIPSVLNQLEVERSEEELEEFWVSNWENFCKQTKGTHFGRCDLLETNRKVLGINEDL